MNDVIESETDRALRRLNEVMPNGWALYTIQRTRFGQYAALVTSLGSKDAADLGQITGQGPSIARAIEDVVSQFTSDRD